MLSSGQVVFLRLHEKGAGVPNLTPSVRLSRRLLPGGGLVSLLISYQTVSHCVRGVRCLLGATFGGAGDTLAATETATDCH